MKTNEYESLHMFQQNAQGAAAAALRKLAEAEIDYAGRMMEAGGGWALVGLLADTAQVRHPPWRNSE
eukprot:9484445-Pyramimonas_sp.AAC.1